MRKISTSKSGIVHMHKEFKLFHSKFTLCGYWEQNIESIRTGTACEVTCKKCKKIIDKLGIE